VDARFLRLQRDGQVENIMVIFEDKSGIRAAERMLQEERERHDAELEAIAAILRTVLFCSGTSSPEVRPSPPSWAHPWEPRRP